jgi:flagellar L-ring protein precursor FlgH
MISPRLFPSILSIVLAAASAARADSLWSRTTYVPRSLYADHKAANPGDIVTIIVQESNAVQSSENTATTRQSSLNDAVTQFLFSQALTHGGQLPSMQTGGKSSYSGGGTVNNSQTANSTAAVLVTDTLPNGNLVIEGVRELTYTGDTEYVVLHGIIRPDDISATDTIPSTSIADARVEFIDKGSLADEAKPGWFGKLYEFLRPF